MLDSFSLFLKIFIAERIKVYLGILALAFLTYRERWFVHLRIELQMKTFATALTLALLISPAVQAQEQESQSSEVQATSAESSPVKRAAIQETPASTKIMPGDTLYVTPNEFGFTMSAAIKKKGVPVKVTTIRSKADFFLVSGTQANKQHTAERVTKILSFGIFAGNGKSFEADVNITNKDGEVIFAESVKRDNPRKASRRIAEKLKQSIEQNASGGRRAY